MLKNNELIFEHILDKEFINIFNPIFFFLRPFGMHGVSIKYKFVTPPTRLYKTYCCIIWAINSTCVVNCIIGCQTRFDAHSTDIPLKAGILINCCIYTYLSWKSVFHKDETNSQLFVKLQRIERVLKMKGPRNLNRKQANMAMIAGIIGFIALIAVFLLFHVYVIKGFCLSATSAVVVSAMSYFEMHLVVMLLYFLTVRARYVNEQFSINEDLKTQESQVYLTYAKNKAAVPDEILKGLCCILESRAEILDTFQHAILLFTFQMLFWQLISMQNIVMSIKTQMSVNIPSFLCTMTSSFVYIIIMMMLCLVSQSLTTTLEITEQLCTKFALSCEGKSRENAKRMIVLLNGKRDATVYDIFTLDTRLPLHLLAVTASYTIVLLQFAVL